MMNNTFIQGTPCTIFANSCQEAANLVLGDGMASFQVGFPGAGQSPHHRLLQKPIEVLYLRKN